MGPLFFTQVQAQDFSVNFQSHQTTGERVIAVIDAESISPYEGMQIVGNIIDSNGNWGFDLPQQSNFSLFVRFYQGFEYGLQQDIKLANITLKLRKISDSKVHLTAHVQHMHRSFTVNFSNLGLHGGHPVITLGDPNTINSSGELLLEEPTYGIISNVAFKGNFSEPITVDYNDGEKQLALQRSDGAVSYHQYIDDENTVVFNNKSGGGNFDFKSNVGGNGIKSVVHINGHYGNVGIGTASPDSKLTVKGKIHAQEVKVTVDAGSVPDYVFSEKYNLISLEELEKYINHNSHLPEVKSAKELGAKGLHLAEMNLLLLKKIEELTLYTIEQEKQINELKELKKEVELLKQLLLNRE
ncbi:hypothetical protein AVL50_09235 [Flammeovirga sp. SJP92]|nr:hypothetical protein AVL50_09235 [Flammeovirga sp. SJP92]